MARAIIPFDIDGVSAPTKWLSPPLTVRDHVVYRGPHLYSHTPMIRIEIDLGLLEHFPTDRLAHFNERLLLLLPGLANHGCSLGRPGGFVSRLKQGTWLGHVIEHVALELQTMAQMPVSRGKTRSIRGKIGHYNVMFEYVFEEAGLCAGQMALDLVASLLEPPLSIFQENVKLYPQAPRSPFEISKTIAVLKQIAQSQRLGPTTDSIVREAQRRGIPWVRLDEHSLVQLGTGRFQRRLRASIAGTTSYLGVETASDKNLTKRFLAAAGVPVPRGEVVRSVDGAVAVARRLGLPVVVKPLDANHGRGVSTNLSSLGEIGPAFERARQHSRKVIVEQFLQGRDYRILVVGGELVAVSERVPAGVVGDGKSTIAALIEAINADPRRGDGHENIMTRIKLDENLNRFLERTGVQLASIPAQGQHVNLSATANLSTGGTAIDRTGDIHPDNAAAARRAALSVGLDIAGIDMLIPDIRRSWRNAGGGVVEVNASPGFRMHTHPSQGKPRDPARAVVSHLYPAHAPTRVPVIAITGTNGKSTTVRMVAHILRYAGKTVGFTSTSGIYVGEEAIWAGDASGPKSARLLLRDSTIDIAVLEVARGGLLREGLGVPECDVGAVLNVSEDHLGLAGVDTVEDLAAVKSIVTESVGRHGISVLNADNTHSLAMARHAGGKLWLFSNHGADSKALREHLDRGRCAVTREPVGGRDHIVFHADGQRTSIVPLEDIPATFGGIARFNVENALAATAIALSQKVAPKIVRDALSVFRSTFEQNPGRFNVYDGHGFRVIMDYAHNPAALRAFFQTIRSMRPAYNRVIGNVSTPGDRREDDIREVGRIAALELDLVVFRELPDNRGRRPAEVIRLLAEGARSIGCPEERIVCVQPEEEATQICLREGRPGDIVILMPTKVEKAWRQMLTFKPRFNSLAEQPAEIAVAAHV